SSRSANGKDDSSIQYVDVIKSLASSQLRLHYFIYNSLNKMLVATKAKLNVAQGAEVQARQVWLSQLELRAHGIEALSDFNVLNRSGLISNYNVNHVSKGDRVLLYCNATPTTFGILLYAAAHNRLDQWLRFYSALFGDFESIPPLSAFADSQEALFKMAGLRTAPLQPPES